ncbi:MAG TPA: class I lanthipeptide [Thermoanaerobaculia bacterium]|nr:class I lanthipeptide [Thermoanaerobaculia bacterium]
MKKKTMKLKLAKETIATLDEISLEAARGGYYTPETYCCPSKTGPTMCYCPVIE